MPTVRKSLVQRFVKLGLVSDHGKASFQLSLLAAVAMANPLEDGNDVIVHYLHLTFVVLSQNVSNCLVLSLEVLNRGSFLGTVLDSTSA